MSGTNVKIIAGSKVVLDTLNEVKAIRIDQAKELKPIASGVLPTIPASPANQDYKMYVSGGKTGATFTGVGLPSDGVTLTKSERGTLWFDKDTRAWSLLDVQELPEVDEENEEGKIVRKEATVHLEYTEIDAIRGEPGSGFFNRQTGALVANSARKIVTFDNLNHNLTYEITATINGSTLVSLVCYYNNIGTFLGSEQPVNSGVSEFNRYRLTLPVGTTTIGTGNSNLSPNIKLEIVEEKKVFNEFLLEKDAEIQYLKGISEKVTSKNIADPICIKSGFAINNNFNGGSGNAINESSSYGDWAVLFLPIDSLNNSHISISGWNSIRDQLYFGKGDFYKGNTISGAASNSSSRLIKSGGLSNLSLPMKVDGKVIIALVPDQTWIAISLKNAEEDISVYKDLMINYGEEYLPYEPYGVENEFFTKLNHKKIGASALIDKSGNFIKYEDLKLTPDTTEEGMAVSFKPNTYESTVIKFNYDGKEFIHNIKPSRPSSLTSSKAFEFQDTYINGVRVHNTGDDGTPYRFNSYTLGANHGYAKNIITSVAHGKGNVDVGSVWSNGVKEWVITNILDANTIELVSRTDNSTLQTDLLTHVSGATNTGSINTENRTSNGHFFPVIKNLIRRCYLDGKEVSVDEAFSLKAKEKVTFTERYDIMNRNSMVEWLITQAGTPTKILDFEGISDVTVSNTYVFDNKGGCTQYQDFLALRDIPNFQDIMFLQVYYGGVDGPIKYYIPKTLPIPYKGVNYDFRQGVNMSSFIFDSTSDNLNFTPEYQASGYELIPDRVIKMQNTVGFAVGFIPERGSAERKVLASRKALQIRGTKKIYMSGVDSASRNSLTAGDYFSSVGYRKFFSKKSDRLTDYIISTKEADYLYLHWEDEKIDRVKLPEYLMGKKAVIVEKSGNVELLTPHPTDTILVQTEEMGFLVLKFLK